ncbi:hypothetical protein LTR94_032548, partial [Friedmanniomyces endolithicus]
QDRPGDRFHHAAAPLHRTRHAAPGHGRRPQCRARHPHPSPERPGHRQADSGAGTGGRLSRTGGRAVRNLRDRAGRGDLHPHAEGRSARSDDPPVRIVRPASLDGRDGRCRGQAQPVLPFATGGERQLRHRRGCWPLDHWSARSCLMGHSCRRAPLRTLYR